MTTAPSHQLPTLLPSDDAAILLGLKPQTLRAWRLRGMGPPYVRIGHGQRGRVFYRGDDLSRWLESRTFGSTSEETAGTSATSRVTPAPR